MKKINLIPPIAANSGPDEVILTDSWKQHMRDIAPVGGSKKTRRKQQAARRNGAKGGRPAHIYIYGIVNAETGRIEYIGQSDNPHKRCQSHFCVNGKYAKCKYAVALVILAVTDLEHANEIEERFYQHYKALGQCEKNGKKYRHYYARSAKWLTDNAI